MAGSKGFLKLGRSLIISETYGALSSDAIKLLVHIAAFHNGWNNGEIRYGVAQAMKLLSCSKPTACRCFAELRAAGLIERTERASFSHKHGARRGLATAWKITFLKNEKRP